MQKLSLIFIILCFQEINVIMMKLLCISRTDYINFQMIDKE
jgi:hypothetical protein